MGWLAITVLGIGIAQASGSATASWSTDGNDATLTGEVDLANLPIERRGDVLLTDHCHVRRHVHYGGYYGGHHGHHGWSAPVRYQSFYYGIPAYQQQYRLYAPYQYSPSYYRSYYGGYGGYGGCQVIW
jgi:hypothetical protein